MKRRTWKTKRKKLPRELLQWKKLSKEKHQIDVGPQSTTSKSVSIHWNWLHFSGSCTLEICCQHQQFYGCAWSFVRLILLCSCEFGLPDDTAFLWRIHLCFFAVNLVCLTALHSSDGFHLCFFAANLVCLTTLFLCCRRVRQTRNIVALAKTVNVLDLLCGSFWGRFIAVALICLAGSTASDHKMTEAVLTEWLVYMPTKWSLHSKSATSTRKDIARVFVSNKFSCVFFW